MKCALDATRMRMSLPGYRSRQQRLRRKPLVTLPAQYHETVIIPVHSPGSRRHFAEIDKFPIAGVETGKAKVISDCRRDIQAGALVQIRSWSFVTKYILPMIGAERSAVFPLGVTDPIIMPDRNPMTFKNGLAIARECLFKPRYDVLSLWFSVAGLYIIVR